MGCLFVLLLVAAVGYFGVEFFDAYYRYYRLRDAMTQEARFAESRNDQMIRRRLRAKADSLGVPDDATFQVRRNRAGIAIWTSYIETVRLPIGTRDLTFEPVIRQGF